MSITVPLALLTALASAKKRVLPFEADVPAPLSRSHPPRRPPDAFPSAKEILGGFKLAAPRLPRKGDALRRGARADPVGGLDDEISVKKPARGDDDQPAKYDRPAGKNGGTHEDGGRKGGADTEKKRWAGEDDDQGKENGAARLLGAANDVGGHDQKDGAAAEEKDAANDGGQRKGEDGAKDGAEGEAPPQKKAEDFQQPVPARRLHAQVSPVTLLFAIAVALFFAGKLWRDKRNVRKRMEIATSEEPLLEMEEFF
jgi:hypothetical protein